MMLKQRVMDPRQRDDISEALAFEVQPEADNPSGKPYREVPAYIYRWHPSGADQKVLKQATVGEASRDLIHMTRYYPTTKPQVVIDFEPAPPEKFWEEEKRRFCMARGLVYVPIYLGETMDVDGFQARVRACERLMIDVHQEAREDAVLGDEAAYRKVGAGSSKTVEDWLLDPELQRYIDAEALQTADQQLDKWGRRIVGSARLHVIRTAKAAIVKEIRGGLRSGRIVDPLERYRQPATTAE